MSSAAMRNGTVMAICTRNVAVVVLPLAPACVLLIIFESASGRGWRKNEGRKIYQTMDYGRSYQVFAKNIDSSQ